MTDLLTRKPLSDRLRLARVAVGINAHVDAGGGELQHVYEVIDEALVALEPNGDDVADAVRLLDGAPEVASWSLTRITNPYHALAPFGTGIGVTVVGMTGDHEPVNVFEKAGHGRSLDDAAETALRRLREQLRAKR